MNSPFGSLLTRWHRVALTAGSLRYSGIGDKRIGVGFGKERVRLTRERWNYEWVYFSEIWARSGLKMG